MLAPNGGEVFGAGQSTEIRWEANEAHPDPHGIRIEVSTNRGENWIPVVRDLSNTGSFHWDLPRSSSQTYILRVSMTDSAGNVGSDVSDEVFVVDGLPPAVRITGPDRAREIPVEITYHVADLGGAGVHKVQLYITRDSGVNWQLYAETLEPGKPFVLEDLDGVYGLWAVSVDRRGNMSATPTRNAPPPFTLSLDRTPPEIRIFEPGADSGAIGGHAFPIVWAAKDNLQMAENGITLEYSDNDGMTWTTIEENVLNTGHYNFWKPPQITGDQYRIRILARDVMGNMSRKESATFPVDAAAPVGFITKAGQEANALRVEYKVRDDVASKVDRVELWSVPMIDPELPWTRYATDGDRDGVMWFRKSDGKYGLAIVVSSKAARFSSTAQKPPGRGDTPQHTVELDFTPPDVQLLHPKAEKSFAAGTAQKVQWRYSDEHVNPEGRVTCRNAYRSPTSARLCLLAPADQTPSPRRRHQT